MNTLYITKLLNLISAIKINDLDDLILVSLMFIGTIGFLTTIFMMIVAADERTHAFLRNNKGEPR